MKTSLKILALLLPLSIAFSSCNKDKKTTDDPVVDTSPSTGTMKIEFTNVVDGEPLKFSKVYTNENGETYTVKRFNYYISNVVLVKADNTPVSVPVYQIIKMSDDTSRTLTLKGIPEGTYKTVKLMLGIDSASNCSGAHSGGLDFVYAADMFWGWNQGYIFLKAEGTSTVSPSGDFSFHIGGFGGPFKSQRNFSFDLVAEKMMITKSTQPKLSLNVNFNELFKEPSTVSLVTNNNILTPNTKETQMIANNYADMIKFGSLKN